MYTKLGYGDFTPECHKSIRPVCLHCGNEFVSASCEIEDFCCSTCWHLANMGEVKAQILCWIAQGMNYDRIIAVMHKYLWFEPMTDSTVGRFKRAIKNRCA